MSVKIALVQSGLSQAGGVSRPKHDGMEVVLQICNFWHGYAETTLSKLERARSGLFRLDNYAGFGKLSMTIVPCPILLSIFTAPP